MDHYLSRLILIIIATYLPLAPLNAQSESGDVPRKVVLSPLGDIYTEFHDVKASNRTEILLTDKNHKNKYLLYAYERSANILFAPDQSYIVINDHNASDESRILLFRHVSSLEYKSLDVDITKKIWDFFCKKYGCENIGGAGPFSHNYIDAILWAADSSSILVSLKGHLDKDNNLSDWYCIYDLKNNSVTLDLSILNRGSAKLKLEK